MFCRVPGAVHGKFAAGPEFLVELAGPRRCWNRDLHQGGNHEPHVQRHPHAGRYISTPDIKDPLTKTQCTLFPPCIFRNSLVFSSMSSMPIFIQIFMCVH